MRLLAALAFVAASSCVLATAGSRFLLRLYLKEAKGLDLPQLPEESIATYTLH